MNCKQFRRNLADEVTSRLTPGEQAKMASHRAVCPECDRCHQAERVLFDTWQELPGDPAPDILPRLAARLGSPMPKSRPRGTGRFVYLAVVGVAAGALVLIPWTQKKTGSRNASRPTHTSVCRGGPGDSPSFGDADGSALALVGGEKRRGRAVL